MKNRVSMSFGILLIGTLFLLAACNKSSNTSADNLSATAPLENQEKTQQAKQPDKNEPEEVWIGKAEAVNAFEYRFYSPDNQHYIAERLELQVTQGEPGPVQTKLYYNNTFLESAYYLFGYEYKQRKTHAIWVSNKEVLINGTYLFNIGDMTKEQISFPKEFSENPQRLLNYRVDPTRKYLVYISLDHTGSIRPEGPEQRGLNVFLYQIEEKTWETIFRKEIVWMPDWEFDSGAIQVFWGADGNLYFNYPIENKTSQIMKFDLKSRKAIDIDTGYNLFDASPDGKYFIIEKQENNVEQIEVNFYAIRSDTFEITAQLPSGRYSWSTATSGELAAVRYIENNSGRKANIEVLSVIDGKTKEIITDNRFSFTPAELSSLHPLIDFYEGKLLVNFGKANFVY